MIPILYDKNEVAFTTNGLGRLRDCIKCVVTEERNGIYECDFEYPMDGANFDLIQIGRIVGVSHDESNDVQPFDIVSYSRPIEGVVTFHAVHISYRQSYMTVAGSNINSLSDAFTLLGTAEPSNPFVYQTDKTSSGYMAAADGVPRTVKQLLGGVEGSILDAYGGEYEWDKWTVILHSSRGQMRDFSIRYGVNMLSYEENLDSSGTYSSCIPYWKGQENIIIGDRVDSGAITLSGRGECVPLDVTDKFENEPTKAEVEAMALSMMQDNNTTVPSQNIKVEFARLQEMGEYANFQSLLTCHLCDSIKVIFPDYNSSGTFKIVKTVWNVLKGRYDEMELGDLSVTLSEALGISDSLGSSGGNTVVNNDYIIVTNTSQQTLSSANTIVKWNVNSAAQQVGTSLTFNSTNHSVVIGAGVNYVAVQGTIYIYTAGTSGLKNVYVYKNNDEVARTVTDIRYNYQSFSTPYRIIEVAEGDEITIRVNSQNGTTTVIAGDNSGGSIEGLFVQVIA